MNWRKTARLIPPALLTFLVINLIQPEESKLTSVSSYRRAFTKSEESPDKALKFRLAPLNIGAAFVQF